jgi:hypothetical protein
MALTRKSSLIFSLIQARSGTSTTGHLGLPARQLDQPDPAWTAILNPEKRKVGGSTPPLTTHLTSGNAGLLSSRCGRC